MRTELALAAIDALETEIAVVDAAGRIVWAGAGWLGAKGMRPHDPLAGAGVGVNVLDLLRVHPSIGGEPVAEGIAAVIRGEQAVFTRELDAGDGSPPWRLMARALRSPQPGAVLLRGEAAERTPEIKAAPPDPPELFDQIAVLSPREREVLGLMVDGLDNRQIAAELGIAYTTVRSHTRSLIDKLGARSRLQAVARAYRAGVRGRR